MQVHYQLQSPISKLKLSDPKIFPVLISANPKPLVNTLDSIDTLVFKVPSYELVQGETFQVEIKSRFRHYLNSAGLKFTLGAGLQFTSIQLSDSFKTAKFDLNEAGNEVSAVFAGRKDGAPVVEQILSTDELLVSANIIVGDVVEGGQGTLEITLLKDLTEQQNGQLTPSEKFGFGAGECRTGLAFGGTPALVHFRENAVVGIFAYATTAVLVNTATVSGTMLETVITAMGVRLRQQVQPLSEGVSCSTQNSVVLGVTNDCHAQLDGDETVGAREVRANIVYGFFAASVPFRVFAVDPASLRMAPSQSSARAIAGWYGPRDDCQEFNYQTVDLGATASFTDGVEVFSRFDVSSMVRPHSNHPSVVTFRRSTVTGALVIHFAGAAIAGVGSITVDIVAARGAARHSMVDGTGIPSNGAHFPAASQITVYDQSVQNRIAVIGLDTIVFSEIADINVKSAVGSTSGYSPNTAFSVSVAG